MPYQIVTDATADLTEELLTGLPRVRIIPMEIQVADEPYFYGREGGISVDTFYQKLRSGCYASTSQVNPAAYMDCFSSVLESGFDLLYLGFTAGMSGMYQNALLCAAELREDYPGRRIICLDTKCAAIGQGMLVREAARRQAEGMSLDDLCDWVEQHKMNACHWFTVDTFEHLRHGGRVSSAVAVVGTALQIKPLLRVSPEGTLEVIEKPRGPKHAMRALLSHMEGGWSPEISTTVIVGHGDCMDRAQDLCREIQTRYPEAQIFIAPIGPVIGSHTGPGMLAVTFWGNGR